MLWDRATLKHYAKEQLRQYYWKAFAVCLVGGLLGGAGSGGGGVNFQYTFSDGTYSLSPGMAAAMLAFALLALAVGMAFTAFVSNPIAVGVCTFFLAAPWGHRDFGLLFSSFHRGRYLSIVKTVFLRDLFVALWSLLFVFPGIYKAYQYHMVPYLISEYPYLTPRQARDLSREMTEGKKWQIFVLELSFIWWFFLPFLVLILGIFAMAAGAYWFLPLTIIGILSMLAAALGLLFIAPYREATMAQLYFALRARVQIPPPPPPPPPQGWVYGQM